MFASRRIITSLEHIQVASKRYEITFELRRNLLSLAPGTQAVAGTVVAVPVLVADDVVQALVEVCLEAKCAEFPLALVLYALFLRRLASTA